MVRDEGFVKDLWYLASDVRASLVEDTSATFAERYKKLKGDYLQRLPEKVQQLEAIWGHLQQDPSNIAGLELLYIHVHGLNGSGATYGFAELSEAARDLELLLKPWLAEAKVLEPEDLQQAGIKLERLKQVVHGLSREDSPILPEAPEFASPQAEKTCKLIYLLERDQGLATDLADQLQRFAYTVHSVGSPAALLDLVSQAAPMAIILDTEFQDPDLVLELASLKKPPKPHIPLIFLSNRDDLLARLQAIRLGGDAFFYHPFDVNELIEKIDTLTGSKVTEPYRILIVDDSEAVSSFYAMVLEHAGMVVQMIHDPLKLMSALNEFMPDLILMDLYMPGYNGMEVAKSIRQQDRFVGIPIVFLSVETNLDKHLVAISLGGDDFLTKPISPEHLVSLMRSRVHRSRILRSFMMRDSLTGLLNHSNLKEQLDLEVKRAKRHNTPLAFAMIDIDHFKVVNDTYGHLIGDRVIKSLSNLLRHSLRKTDIIGRYGGEEFAVILPNTDGRNAAEVFDQIRTNFSKISHTAEEGRDFRVTFSCGIASFPMCQEAYEINDWADKVLYEVKQNGRNQVMLAEEQAIVAARAEATPEQSPCLPS